MIRRPPRSTQSRSSAASDVYKRQVVEVVLVHIKLAQHQLEHIQYQHQFRLVLVVVLLKLLVVLVVVELSRILELQ